MSSGLPSRATTPTPLSRTLHSQAPEVSCVNKGPIGVALCLSGEVDEAARIVGRTRRCRCQLHVELVVHTGSPTAARISLRP